jgi:hypothetical protein
MSIFGDLAKGVVSNFESRATPFYAIDCVSMIKRNKDVIRLFDAIRTLPKKFDVRGELNDSIERAIHRELGRKTNGWRVFESFPDPESHEGRHRLFMPLRYMNYHQLDGAQKQVREERKDLVNKEERYKILMDLLKAAGPRATVADVIDQADAEIARRRSA